MSPSIETGEVNQPALILPGEDECVEALEKAPTSTEEDRLAWLGTSRLQVVVPLTVYLFYFYEGTFVFVPFRWSRRTTFQGSLNNSFAGRRHKPLVLRLSALPEPLDRMNLQFRRLFPPVELKRANTRSPCPCEARSVENPAGFDLVTWSQLDRLSQAEFFSLIPHRLNSP